MSLLEDSNDQMEMFFSVESTRYSIESKSSDDRDRTYSTTSVDSIEPELANIESVQKQWILQDKSKSITIPRKREMPLQEIAKTPTPSKYYTMLQTNGKIIDSLKK